MRLVFATEKVGQSLFQMPLSRAALIALVSISVLWPSPSFATGCGSEESIFVRPATSDANGTLNVIEMHDRDLNSDCLTNYAVAWSTAHMNSGGNFDVQAEVGFDE
jgi:hypothetical protein